jgi:hypothetical protein
MKNSIYILLSIFLISCYSSGKLNNDTGFYEKEKVQLTPHFQGYHYKEIEKIYNEQVLIAKRTSKYFHGDVAVQPVGKLIEFYDSNKKIIKSIEYQHLDESFGALKRIMTELYSNGAIKNQNVDTIELSAYKEMMIEFLYRKE